MTQLNPSLVAVSKVETLADRIAEGGVGLKRIVEMAVELSNTRNIYKAAATPSSTSNSKGMDKAEEEEEDCYGSDDDSEGEGTDVIADVVNEADHRDRGHHHSNNASLQIRLSDFLDFICTAAAEGEKVGQIAPVTLTLNYFTPKLYYLLFISPQLNPKMYPRLRRKLEAATTRRTLDSDACPAAAAAARLLGLGWEPSTRPRGSR